MESAALNWIVGGVSLFIIVLAFAIGLVLIPLDGSKNENEKELIKTSTKLALKIIVVFGVFAILAYFQLALHVIGLIVGALIVGFTLKGLYEVFRAFLPEKQKGKREISAVSNQVIHLSNGDKLKVIEDNDELPEGYDVDSSSEPQPVSGTERLISEQTEGLNMSRTGIVLE